MEHAVLVAQNDDDVDFSPLGSHETTNKREIQKRLEPSFYCYVMYATPSWIITSRVYQESHLFKGFLCFFCSCE